MIGEDKIRIEGGNAVEAFGRLLDGMRPMMRRCRMPDCIHVEEMLRTGIRGLRLLCAVRQFFLDTPELGGEHSPFVEKIDELMPREGKADDDQLRAGG